MHRTAQQDAALDVDGRMHESKHVSRGGSLGRAGDAEQQTAGAHRRDSGVGVGQPEEAISRFNSQDC